MFGEQFYPTPLKLAKTIIGNLPQCDTHFKRRNYAVLDPSAGSGAFLDAFVEFYTGDLYEWEKDRELAKAKSMCQAIEIDADLQSVLMGKGYTVVDSDFTRHKSFRHYNVVLMNPPFAKGAKHLLHAWDNLWFDNLACILNAETILNPYTHERQRLVSIIEENGFHVDFMQSQFSDADKKTNVEIAVVYMAKKQQKNIFDPVVGDGIEFVPIGDTIDDINELAKPDVIGNLVRQYDATIQEYVEFRRAARKMARMEKLWHWPSQNHNDIPDRATSISGSSSMSDQLQFDNFTQRLTSAAWNTVFNVTGMMGKMTADVQKQFAENQQRAGALAFNEQNIYNIIEALMQNTGAMMAQCVYDVFDYFTKYHDENKVHFEGWKTNDAFEVGRKVIVPYAVSMGYSGRMSVRYERSQNVHDIDRAICFLSAV